MKTINLTATLDYGMGIASKVFPIALSFVDDIFFLLLAKLGIHVPGMTWLGPTLFVGTILLLIVRWLVNR